MHIIFGNVGIWQMFLMRLLKYFNFKVFYLFIESKSIFQESEIATNLKKKNIIPLPIEFGKNISLKAYSLYAEDTEESAYKKNIKMVSNKILLKYSNLFLINEKKVKKLRLLLQDVIASEQKILSAPISIWANLHPSEKIILISFKFKNFFAPNIDSNVTKIIIPLDIFYYFMKSFLKNFLFFLRFNNRKNKNQKDKILDSHNFKDLAEKKVAYVVHKGLTYGRKSSPLFYKSLYYSDDKNSPLNKHNILHLDYSNYSKPENDIYWICLKKMKVSTTKIFFKNVLASIKTFYLIRNWSTFLVWVLFNQQYKTFLEYDEIIKKFKNLKIAIIDYDCLCPKTLIFVFNKNNIETVATQERFITSFFTSYQNVILDTYYAMSEYAAKIINNSKYHEVKNIVPIGQYRSDYISLYKNETVPREISNAKNSGKKILVVFGNNSADYWFGSYPDPLTNWTAQLNFLEDCFRLSQNLKNTFVVLRYKFLEWSENEYFEKFLYKMHNNENIIISNNYEEYFYSYKLSAHADLVIAKHTSIADECLVNEIPVLFHEYSHNMKKNAIIDIPNYLPDNLICRNIEELLAKSKSLLFNEASDLKDEISKLSKTIYYIRKKGNIKNKIISDCMRIIGNR